MFSIFGPLGLGGWACVQCFRAFWDLAAESSRGNTIRGNRAHSSERKMALLTVALRGCHTELAQKISEFSLPRQCSRNSIPPVALSCYEYFGFSPLPLQVLQKVFTKGIETDHQ